MSNFSVFEVNYDGQIWKTSEYAYQAAKLPKEFSVYKESLTATSAHDALKLAERNYERCRPDWNETEKSRVMTVMCRLNTISVNTFSVSCWNLITRSSLKILQQTCFGAVALIGKVAMSFEKSG